MFGLKSFVFGLSALWVLSVSIHAAEVDAVVKTATGKVEFAAPGSSSFQALVAGAKLKQGSTVRTGADGEAVVTVVPGAAVKIAPGTTVRLEGMEFVAEGGAVKKRKANLKLSSGTVSALIDARTPEATDFRIQTPHGVAAARGTFYAVKVDKGETFVLVKEGKVGASAAKDEKKADATTANLDDGEWEPLASTQSP